MSLTVNLYYTGKNGSARRFAEEMERSGTAAAVRAEEGNLRYEYFYPSDDPETVLLIDSWRDQKALDAHHASPMMKTIAELREKYNLHLRVERYIPEKEVSKEALSREVPEAELSTETLSGSKTDTDQSGKISEVTATGENTDLLKLMKHRRSIRKYTKQRIEREKLEKILEAGIAAPNPGGIQGTKIIMVDNAELIGKIGIVNANVENRNWSFTVSKEQPSIIDDKSIRSGFYGARALGIVCIQRERKRHENHIGSAYICAQNMVLEAYALGVSSCIVGRAEATFTQPGMQELLDSWGLDPAYMPMVFVCLGYIDGPYPKEKPRLPGRTLWVE